MASISAADFTPIVKPGNNKFSRVLRHKSGVEVTASTVTEREGDVVWYVRNDRKIPHKMTRKICFALWLALYRTGVTLG